MWSKGVLFVFIVKLLTAQAYEVCSSFGSYYKYCEDGYHCCHIDRCCRDPTPLSTGGIIAMAVCIPVGIIIIIACVCVRVQMSKRRAERVIGPQGGTTVVSQPGQVPQYGQAAPVYGQQPPGYDIQQSPGYGTQQPPGYPPQSSGQAYPPPQHPPPNIYS